MQTFPPPHSTLAFGDFSGQDAVGVMLAHSLTAGAQRFRKGHVLSAEDVALLHAAGIATVSGARLAADDLAENPAAEQVAALLAGPNTQARVASGGRSNLHATAAGIVVIDAERIVRANLVDEAVAIGTLANGKQGEHTGGYRFGRWTEIRDYYHEEVEKALQGKQSAKEAIDNSIKRGNAALRAFEKTAATN